VVDLDSKIELFEIPFFTDLSAALSFAKVDLIIIATQPDSHFKYASLILEKGVPFLVTKPISVNFSETNKIISLSRKSNTNFFVDHTFTYSYPFKFIKQIVESSKLGAVKKIYTNRSNFGRFYKSIGVHFDLTIHDLVLIHYLVNDEVKHFSVESYWDNSRKSIDSVAINLTYPDGVKAFIYSSRVNPKKTRDFLVLFENGSIFWDDTEVNSKKLLMTKYSDTNKEEIIEQKYVLVDESESALMHELNYIELNLNETNDIYRDDLLKIYNLLDKIDLALQKS
jgi:predicted dehydrogenase